MRHGYLNYHEIKEEGVVKITKDFDDVPHTIQLDIIGDWIAELQQLYENIQSEVYRPKNRTKRHGT